MRPPIGFLLYYLYSGFISGGCIMSKIIFLILLLAPAFTWAGDSPAPNAYKTIASDLLKDCTGTDKAVAVAGFSYSDGRDSRDGGVVAERITTELVKLKKFQVIERKEIEKVFEELKLQRSGAIDPDYAKEIGKMLGADWVVVGTLTELPNKQLELNTRLVGVESGEIINAGNARLRKDWLDQYRKLLNEQNKIILKNSKDAQVFYEKGVMYADLEEYDNAIGSFGIAININPAYLKAYFGRGNAYENNGESDKAIKDLSEAIAIDPKYTEAYFIRGKAYGEDENDKAIEDYSKAIAINSKYAEAYFFRGLAYAQTGELDKAIEDLSKAIAIDPKNAVACLAYVTRGTAYAHKGEYDKAIEDFSKAIAINPKYAAAYYNRGVVYVKNEEWDKAMPDMNMAKQLEPGKYHY